MPFPPLPAPLCPALGAAPLLFRPGARRRVERQHEPAVHRVPPDLLSGLSPLAWATNLTSAVVKTPKVFWGDLGLWVHLTRYQGDVTGQMFETLVVTEIHKWVKTADLPVDLSFSIAPARTGG